MQLLERSRVLWFLFLGAAVAALALVIALWTPSGAAEADPGGRLEYKVNAHSPRLNREVLGEVTDSVMGVPAEPVDSFVWDGNGSEPIRGSARLQIDPVDNEGFIRAEWSDRHSNWRFEQTSFFAPDHADGLRVVAMADNTELEFGDGVPLNVYLHGDTTAGGPVLPTIFNHIATWGPARVWLNGELFENPYDDGGPSPLWVAHTMTTVGVRQPDGTVRTQSGDIFSAANPGDGATDDTDMEFHLVFHDAPGPEMTENFPPPLSFFYHLTFEDVKMEVNHRD